MSEPKYILQSKDVSVFAPEGAEPDPVALEQLTNCLLHPGAVAGALMADHHVGYAMPIGGVVKYDADHVSPSGVGFDIACGNLAVATDIRIQDLLGLSDFGMEIAGDSELMIESIKPLMREIQKKIEFGVGKQNELRFDHECLHEEFEPVWEEIDKQFGPELHEKARAQLGTVGSGNHYVDLLVDEGGYIWVANHFGSRGLGHTIAGGFMAAAKGLKFTERVNEPEESVVLSTETELGAFYVGAMQLAGQYAYAGREYVMDEVLKILGNPNVTSSIHNHHNYAFHSSKDGSWYVAKGATPLTDQPAFIGGSMGDISVIVRGKWRDDPLRRLPPTIEDIGALGFAPHGAGRVMSRTAAAGKFRKMWSCSNRDCDFSERAEPGNAMRGGTCPSCGGNKFRKIRARDPETAGIDWDAARASLTARGITVLGAGADESPGVYKSLESVLEAHSNIEVLEILEPIGVVMAGADTYDPYRD